jgi:hypothetical protein
MGFSPLPAPISPFRIIHFKICGGIAYFARLRARLVCQVTSAAGRAGLMFVIHRASA